MTCINCCQLLNEDCSYCLANVSQQSKSRLFFSTQGWAYIRQKPVTHFLRVPDEPCIRQRFNNSKHFKKWHTYLREKKKGSVNYYACIQKQAPNQESEHAPNRFVHNGLSKKHSTNRFRVTLPILTPFSSHVLSRTGNVYASD